MALISHLFRHHKWANLVLIDHLGGLSDDDLARRAPGGFGTIHETLFHYVANEARFVAALNGKPLEEIAPPPSGLPPLSTLRGLAETQGEQLLGFASQLDEDTRISGTFNGQPYDRPAYLPLFQAYHHAVEHRTNITSILATYDLLTPQLDLWAFQAADEAP